MHCIFHPEQYITNFCESEKCLLPLCPVCVKLHSEEHIRTDRLGVFELIDSCISKTAEELRAYRDMFTICQNKTVQVNEHRKTLEAQLVEQVKQAKAALFQELEARFVELQSQINMILDQKERDLLKHLQGVASIVDAKCAVIDSSLTEISHPQTCLNALIQYYYFKRERTQDWDHALLSCNELVRMACESRSLAFRTNPQATVSLRALLSNYAHLTAESIPLPTLELPIVTQSNRTRYTSCDKCCTPLCAPSSKFVRV